MPSRIFWRWSWLVLAGFLLLVVLAASIALRYKFNDDLTIARTAAKQQSQLIASLLENKLNSGQYQDIDKLFIKLGETNDNIVALSLVAANGYPLANYKSAVVKVHTVVLKSTIAYSYHGLATLTAVIDLDEVYQRNRVLVMQIAVLMVIFALSFSLLLYIAIQRQKEMLRSQYLSNLYKALSEVNQAIVRIDREADLFPLVCRCAVDFGGMWMAWVGVLDAESGRILPAASHGKNTDILNTIVISSAADGATGLTPISVALRENRNVIINDSAADAVTSIQMKKDAQTLFGSTAVFPIPKHGKPYAVMQVYHARRDGFDDDCIALLEEMVRDISFALDNFDREMQRNEAVKSLQLAASVYAASSEGILITNANNRIISVNPAFTEITGYTAAEVIDKDPSILNSGHHNADFYLAMWQSIEATGKWNGEIWDRRKNGEIYPKWLTIDTIFNTDGSVLRRVALFTDITKKKEAENKIQHLAFYDHLTGLPNRLLFLDRLKQAMAANARSSLKGSLLFIDIDNFKNLNDTLGHDIGDLLLQQISQRLESCLRKGDTVARLGGDEFVVMLLDLSEQSMEAAAQTEIIGEKMLLALSQPYQLDKHLHRCTASIGATLFKEYPGADELMKQADIAMYQAKKAGRNALRFFDPHMQTSISARVTLEADLHNALESAQFQLYYQIQVDELYRPLGVEALIRWAHPQRGLISPSQFIPLAEETGLIASIGQWVLETACLQLLQWQQDEATRHLTLAVNVSAKQFRQADFVEQVKSCIQRIAINPAMLKLELTESMLLDNVEDTIATMNTLNDFGVQFSLDDFGTGYSSLQYLKRLPLDQLKIDQSFVRDISTDSSDMAIVRTIVAMAQSMDIAVIAEGVETKSQRQLLLNLGCTQFQGYLFGRPLPIDQFTALLKQI